MKADRISTARTYLRQHWKHSEFRPEQAAALGAVLQGRDVLMATATGSGKSLCYQIPPLVVKGVTLVVSPLIALMQNQVESLTERGIAATYLARTLPKRQFEKRLDEVADGKYRVLYVSPERLQSRHFRARAPKLNVTLFAVDEAHCVSVWGHDFRPSYRLIPESYALMGRPPVLAATGTATPRVQEDLAAGLKLRNAVRVIGRFDRSNIDLRLVVDTNPATALEQALRDNQGSGIVYAGTRRNVTVWHKLLHRGGYKPVSYHGGMTARERTSAYRKWMSGKARVVVATNAFGMGIDKLDVRFVVHMEPPYSLEAYYQEAGRAGRDGKYAQAILITSEKDAKMQDRIVDRRFPLPSEVQAVFDSICSRGKVAIGSRPRRPVPVDLAATAKDTGLSAAAVERIINLLAERGEWSAKPGAVGSGMIRLQQPAHSIRRFSRGLTNEDRYRFVIALLRTVEAGAYRDWMPVELGTMASRLSLSQSQLLSELAFLEERQIVSWRTVSGDLQLRFRRERTMRPYVDHAALWRNRRRALEQLEDMRRYMRDRECRGLLLLKYFGDSAAAPCGHCDLCHRRL